MDEQQKILIFNFWEKYSTSAKNKRSKAFMTVHSRTQPKAAPRSPSYDTD